MINTIERELLKLENSGSFFSIEERIKIYQNISYILENIKEYHNILKLYQDRLKKITREFIKTKTLYGISTSINIEKDVINITEGTTYKNTKIDRNTYFDVASITKFFTLLLYFNLENEGLINKKEKVVDIDSKYSYLEDYKIEDILNMRGEIRTRKRLDECTNKEDALKELRKTYLFDSDLKKYKYTDIGLIILANLIEKRVNKINNSSFNYFEIMDKYLLKKYGFKSTYYPKGVIAGSGRNDFLVNDSKARIIGPTAHAGLFMNIEDIKTIRNLLFYENIFTEKQLKMLYESNKPKSVVGLYQKYVDISKTYVPASFSFSSFASEGYTGSTLIFDLQNKIIDAILVDAIDIGKKVKRNGFKESVNDYQKEVTDLTIEAKVLKKIYNRIYN